MPDSVIEVAREFWVEHKWERRKELLEMEGKERRSYVCAWVARKGRARDVSEGVMGWENFNMWWLVAADIMRGLENGTRGILGVEWGKKRRGVQKRAFYEGVVGRNKKRGAI